MSKTTQELAALVVDAACNLVNVTSEEIVPYIEAKAAGEKLVLAVDAYHESLSKELQN